MRQINPGAAIMSMIVKMGEASEIRRNSKHTFKNKFKRGWSVAKAKKNYIARITSKLPELKMETVEEYLARGGKITKVPSAEL